MVLRISFCESPLKSCACTANVVHVNSKIPGKDKARCSFIVLVSTGNQKPEATCFASFP
jgi:hypothetical protein